MSQQLFSVEVDTRYTASQRKAIAQDIIDFIIDRTSQGKDKNGKSFPRYSDAYRKSMDFKIAGKGSTVNLTLTGEMLFSLKYIESQSFAGRIAIGYDGRASINGKVEGNITGSYGKPNPDPSKARDFLGISDKDLKAILRRYELDDPFKIAESMEIAKAKGTAAKEVLTMIKGEDLTDLADILEYYENLK